MKTNNNLMLDDMLTTIERMHDQDVVIINAVQKLHNDNKLLRMAIRKLITREKVLTKKGFIVVLEK